MPPLSPSKSKVSTTQLSYVPPYPLLSQKSASLNCHMPPSTSFSIKGQQHSIVICPPPPTSSSKVSLTQLSYVPHLSPSPSKVSITQLSYAPVYPLLNQSSARIKYHMSPSALFSLKDPNHSTVLGPLSTPFYLKCLHHSTVVCLHLPLFNQR